MTKTRLLFLVFLPLLVSCVSKEGLSAESSRPPRGNPNSSILIEEFTDFQCPACRGAHTQIVQPLLQKYERSIRFDLRHFPLQQIHARAESTAEAAECAADQGKFWEFVDDTYENQEKLQEEDLIARAESLGLADMDLFRRCVKSRIKRDVVQADEREGQRRGVRGTPTFFINGERVERNTLEDLSSAIDAKLGERKL